MFVQEYTATAVKTQAKPKRQPLTSANVQDIVACAVYAVTVGARGMELSMLRSQWSQRGQALFDLALAGANQGKEWAK